MAIYVLRGSIWYVVPLTMIIHPDNARKGQDYFLNKQ